MVDMLRSLPTKAVLTVRMAERRAEIRNDKKALGNQLLALPAKVVTGEKAAKVVETL